jgi:hypothetical protein
MPVLFARRSGAPNVTRLRARLRYTSGILTFLRIEDAYLSRKEAQGDSAQGVLEIDFELPNPGSTRFPSGQTASIFFKIAEGAPIGIISVPVDAWIDGKEVKRFPDSSLRELLLLYPLRSQGR